MNNSTYIIQLINTHRRRVKYLKAHRAAKIRTYENFGKDIRERIITTDFKDNARGFATMEEAEAFRDLHWHRFLGYTWTVVEREIVMEVK